MIVVFLDTNVLVSALMGARDSPPQVLVDSLSRNPVVRLTKGRGCVQEVSKICAVAGDGEYSR